MEQFLGGVEHRVLLVDNKIVAVTRRIPANVVGDGCSTIEELVEEKNRDRGIIHKPLAINHETSRVIEKQSMVLSSVPDFGQRVYLRSTSNLHTGGDAVDATDELGVEERELAERATRAVPGLRLAGLDLLVSTQAGTSSSVLEINSNPMISMHHFPMEGSPRDAAARVLDAMFPSLVSM